MKLAYQAFDRSGQQVVDTIEAANVADATETLRRRDLFVTTITPEGRTGSARSTRRKLRIGGGGRLKNTAMFMRQLHVLVSSGTPLVESLGALQRQVKEGPWQDTIAEIRDGVEEGAPMAEMMERHPESFDAVTRSLIAAGESSGNMAPMLDRLAELTKRRLHVRNAVRGALMYPCLLSTIALGVFLLLLLFVIPRFDQLFRTLDVPLPSSTKALICVSDALRSAWWAGLLAAGAAALGARFYLRTPAGRRRVDGIILRLPQIGGILRNFATARIVRLLGTLLESHVPALDSLQLTRQAAGNVHYTELVKRAENAVARGDPISSAFANTALISPSVYEAIRNGEQSGQIGPLLLHVAEFLDDENETIVRSLTTILEPVILVALGLLVGLVAISMFMPLFDLTAMTQGGGA